MPRPYPLLLAIVAAGLVPCLAAPAEAWPAGARRCQLRSVTDTSGGGGQTGRLDGGPIGDPARPGADVRLRCTVRLSINRHDGPAVVAVESGTSTGVATIAPAAVSYPLPENEPVYVCTEVRVDTTTYYLTDIGTWSTSPAVRCQIAYRRNVRVDPDGRGAEGRRCTAMSITDPTVENGEVQTGEIEGGPLVAADLHTTSARPTSAFSMTCTIQIGAANARHSGADTVSAASPEGFGFAVVAPSPFTFRYPDGQPFFVCTEVSIDGVPYYWDAGRAIFTTDGDVPCHEAVNQEIFPGAFLGGYLDRTFHAFDEAVCGPLGLLAPAAPGVIDVDGDGNVFVFGHPFCVYWTTVPEDRFTVGAGGASVWIVCSGAHRLTACA